MHRWWWDLRIRHCREMQAACIAHGDLQGAKIYVSAEATATEWLGTDPAELRDNLDEA